MYSASFCGRLLYAFAKIEPGTLVGTQHDAKSTADDVGNVRGRVGAIAVQQHRCLFSGGAFAIEIDGDASNLVALEMLVRSRIPQGQDDTSLTEFAPRPTLCPLAYCRASNIAGIAAEPRGDGDADLHPH